MHEGWRLSKGGLCLVSGPQLSTCARRALHGGWPQPGGCEHGQVMVWLLCRPPPKAGRLGADVLRVMPSKAIELAAFDGFKRLFARVPLTLPRGGGPNYWLDSVAAKDRALGPPATMIAGALAGAPPPQAPPF